MPRTLHPIGSLGDISPSDIFVSIIEKSFSGVLLIEGNEGKKAFVFDHSRPISTQSNLEQERIGQILVHRGIVKPEHLDPLLLKQKDMGKTLCEVLVSDGILDPLDVEKHLADQLLLRIANTFTWREGRYKFVDRMPERIIRISVSASLPEICFQALKDVHRKSQGRLSLPREAKPLVVANRYLSVQNLGMTPKELAMYRSISGTTTIEQFVASQPTGSPEETLSFLSALIELDLLKLQPAAPTEAPTEEANLFSDLREKIVQLKNKSHFDVLGVTPQDNVDAIKKSYLQLIKTYHPDKFKNLSPDDKSVLQSYVGKITTAYDVLGNPKLRQDYLTKLELEKSGLSEEKVDDVLESEMAFQKGLMSMRKSAFSEAAEHFQNAINLYNQEPEYYMNLGWALFRLGQKQNQKALVRDGIVNLKKSLEMRPELAQAYYYLGLIEKSLDRPDYARAYFKKTVEYNPKHPEANTEIRLMNMRQQKTVPGIKISDFFKKR